MIALELQFFPFVELVELFSQQKRREIDFSSAIPKQKRLKKDKKKKNEKKKYK